MGVQCFGQFDSTFLISNMRLRNITNVDFGDINSDGIEDIVVSAGDFQSLWDPGIEKIVWYEGKLNGEFELRETLSKQASTANSVSLVDIDQDGDLDIVFADYEKSVVPFEFGQPVNPTLKTIENIGNGIFGEPQLIFSGTYGKINFKIAYLNSNEIMDIVITNPFFNDALQYQAPFILSGVSFESINDTIELSISNECSIIGVIDMNGDSMPDIIYSGSQNEQDTIFIRINSSNFQFLPNDTIVLDNHTQKIQILDISGDGIPDIIELQPDNSLNYWLSENAYTNYSSFNIPPDDLISNYLVSNSCSESNSIYVYYTVYPNTLNIYKINTNNYSSELFSSTCFQAGDNTPIVEHPCNLGNSNQFLIFSIYDFIRHFTIENNIDLVQVVQVSGDENSYFLKVVDFDNDGKLDILGTNVWYKQLENNQFTKAIKIFQFPDCEKPLVIDVGDVNSDGLIDIIATYDSEFYYSLNNGSYIFTDYLPIYGNNSVGYFNVLLINGIENQNSRIFRMDQNTNEFLVSRYSFILNDFEVIQVLNNEISTLNDYELIYIEDFNHDNRNDIISIGFGTNSSFRPLKVYSNVSEDLFEHTETYEFECEVIGNNDFKTYLLADFNNNGTNDLALLNSTFDGSLSKIAIYFDFLSGSINYPSQSVLLPYYINDLKVNDINLDGSIDIVAATLNGERLIWLENLNSEFSDNALVIEMDYPYGFVTKIESRDVTNNGTEDLVIFSSYNNRLELLYNEMEEPLAFNSICNNSIRIFPNPSTGVIKIEFDNSSPYEIEVFDTRFRLLHKSTSIYPTTLINLASFPKGILIVKTTTGQGKVFFNKIVSL